MIKLICSDMDGTLLDDNKELVEETYQLVDALLAKDIEVCIATGRQYYTLIEKFKGYEDKLHFVCDNGTYIVSKNEIITSSINPEQVDKVTSTFRNTHQPSDALVYCSGGRAYILETSEELFNEISSYCSGLISIKDPSELAEGVNKISIYAMNDITDEFFAGFKQYSDLSVCVSSTKWIDISMDQVSKGSAIEQLQAKLDISKEHTLSIGDYLNDYEMMLSSGCRVAMGNAHPDLKAICNYQTASNTEQGAQQVLAKVLKYGHLD